MVQMAHGVLEPAGRGSLLLLDHCARLERLTGNRGRSARERLEAELGSDLARRLLGTLCRDSGPGRRPVDVSL
jgi:hypothetical protein